MTATRHDPVSVEIHRKALDNITAEMAITLTRTSGSPVVYEVQDFATCLMDAAGEHLSMSATVLFHSASSLIGTQALIAAAAAEGEVRPGDGWIVNDSFEAGAMHQGDVAIIMPQFYEGKHVGWAFSNVHVADIGGMSISGYAPGAFSVFDEGLRFGPTKVIVDGVLDPGWERLFKTNVRVADLVLNDIRSMIAANNVAQQKLTEVIDRYGLDRFVEYCEVNKQLTEEAFRERIAKLPDGVYEAASWSEFDGHGEDLLFEFRATMEIHGTDMSFRLSGDPQAQGYINGTRGAVIGNLMAAILTKLAYGDLPFNAGMWRPLSIDIGERGTIINAEPPAPLSAGHSTTGLRLTRVIHEVLNQACALSEDPVVRGRVSGTGSDNVSLYPLTGRGHGGVPTVVFFMDHGAGNGGGAQSIGDGQDLYGATCMPGAGLPSIETNEGLQPALYLSRRLVPNSGGPGLYRGGQALENAFAVYDTDRLDGAMLVGCAEIPAHGVGGGLAGGTGSWDATRRTNVVQSLADGKLPTRETLTGETPTVPSNVSRLTLNRGDVVRVAGVGGGGVGDPLLRDSEAVAKDVRDRYVTTKNARGAYGVVLDNDNRVDPEATAALRAEIRRKRLGADPERVQGAPEIPGVSVAIGADRHWHCACCGHDLGTAGQDWRPNAVKQQVPIADRFAELDMYVRRREGDSFVVLEEYFCPGCAGLLLARSFPNGASGSGIARPAGDFAASN
jgi:N-methylhydantoinase B